MIITAGRGCFLTQSSDIPFRFRKFETSVEITNMEEASDWKQITAEDKESMENSELFFNVDAVDVMYLKKVDTLLARVSDKINDAALTNDEALSVQKYYPDWNDIQGKQVYKGFRFNYEGSLFEVVEPHVVSEDKKPNILEPVAIPETADETQEPAVAEKVYYIQVMPTPVSENILSNEENIK